ncbi:hypothetical protein L873DRAFT_1935777 [Choiromyces venosus 120613-1]|uniref:Uncharacterized protein n=1 Tax=Choiromyces venosus 120613-1 TaxID=1336337 RepID=A0A3N4JDD5_9PEZI|nr:hypothetical protein L873DRAFT_1935777 [Choiromyces venosus 120613-1]
MSFVFEGFGAGLTEHVQAHERTSDILRTYLHGVIHAPCLILSLGKELERLRALLGQIIDENNNPHSTVLRIDNKIAAHKTLQLAVTGVNATLDDAENLLRSCRIHAAQTEKWWANFGMKMRFNGGDRGLLNALEDIKYHCWVFEVAYRVLRRDHIDALLGIADPTEQYLEQLLSLLTASAGGTVDDSIVIKFNENSAINGGTFTNDFKLDTILKSCMYWVYKSSSDIKNAGISGTPTAEGWLNLLKSYWIYSKIREDPRSERIVRELQAILTIVSTELAFSMKRLLEAKAELPDWNTLNNLGDFRILIDDADEEIELPISEKHTSKQHSPKPPTENIPNVPGVQMSNVAVHPAEYSTYESYSTEGYPDDELENVFHSLGVGSRRSQYEKSPQHLKESQLVSEREDTLQSAKGPSLGRSNTQILRKKVPEATPPSSLPDIGASGSGSMSYVDGLRIAKNKRDASSQNASDTSKSGFPEERRLDSPTLGNFSASRSSATTTPTPASPINSMQFGVPPLQPSRQKEHAVPRKPSSLNQSYYSTKPLPPLNTSAAPFSPADVSPADFDAHRGRALGASQSQGGGMPARNGYLSPVSPTYPYAAARNSSGSFSEPVEHGVRPGETELMKDEFKTMNVLASDSCGPEGKWDECIVRIFRNAMGDLRVLTQREGSTDQRFVVLKDAELVPEYGYHENLPVIFIRKAGIGGYSIQSGSKGKSTLSSAELCPITLYYRFKNVMDMFLFQLAFTGESVEADVQAVRTIRYKRGLLDGEHCNYKARIQLWKEEDNAGVSSEESSRTPSIAGTFRSKPNRSSILKVHSTRLVMYFDEIIMTLFITDDITIEAKTKSRCLRIRPSSHKAFGNPGSVKACIIGNRDLSGGIRLDMEGLLIDDQESFDEFKWFEIDFQTLEEMKNFHEDFQGALQERRKERRNAEELQRKAATGARSSG